MILCIKLTLSSIWNSNHKKVRQHWDWVEKSVTYEKKNKHVTDFLIPINIFPESYFSSSIWNFIQFEEINRTQGRTHVSYCDCNETFLGLIKKIVRSLQKKGNLVPKKTEN